MSLSDFQNHMKIVADYMDAEVWVVSPDGELLMDSDDPSIGIDIQNDSSKPVVIGCLLLFDIVCGEMLCKGAYNEKSNDTVNQVAD